ncbi:MAG: WG repeat-containing protein [Candidatus Symbiothrix sp.]|jgi:hypothetical protein|nr:WG repeat-containing protein [Candidatus Symbiothrix sp.]
MHTKFVLTLLLAGLVASGVQAQKNEKWARVYIDGKFGVIGKNGNEIVAPEYDMIGRFDKKTAPAIAKGEAQGINELGQRVPYTPDSKGKAIAYQENGKWGLKSDKGIVLAEPQYDFIGKFNDGKAAVTVGDKMGVVSDKGKEIIVPSIYHFIDDFNKGVAVVLLDSLMGLVDDKGVEVVPPRYNLIRKIKDNNFLVLKNGLWGVLNRNGQETVAPKYAAIFECKDGFKTLSDDKVGLLNGNGALVFEPTYDDIYDKDNNVFIVTLTGKYGLLNKDGKQLLSPTYNYISKFDDGRAFILRDGAWGLINNEGTELIAPKYNAIEATKDKCYIIHKDGKKGLVNREGIVIVQPKYHDISIF